MIHFNYFKCDQCRYPYDFWMFGVSTKIGPEYAECRKCKAIIQTNRLEWKQFSGKQKIITALVSLLYVVGGGYTFGAVFHRLETKKFNDSIGNLPDHYYTAGVSFVVALLVIKLVLSNKRFEQNPEQPSQDGMFSTGLAYATQLKVIFLILMLYCLGGAFN